MLKVSFGMNSCSSMARSPCLLPKERMGKRCILAATSKRCALTANVKSGLRPTILQHERQSANQRMEPTQAVGGMLSKAEHDEGKTALLMTKLWYGVFSCSAVSLIPYLAVWLNSLGVSDGQIGVAMALRPWLAAVTMLAVPTIADVKYIHRRLVMFCFVVSTLLRCGMLVLAMNGFSTTNIIMVLIVAEMLGAPVAPIVDSLAVATCKKYHSTYGKQRLWGSIGWGAFALPSGIIIQQFGAQAGFWVYGILAIPCIPVIWNLRYPRRLTIESPLEGLLGAGMDQIAAEMPEAIRSMEENILQSRDGYEDDEDEEDGCSTPDPAAYRPSARAMELFSKVESLRNQLPSAYSSTTSEEGSSSDGYENTTDTVEELKTLLGNPTTWLFLGQCFILGAIITGLIGTYIFLYAKQMGASASFMGTILMVNCLAEVVFFRYQEKILTIMSPQNLINLALGGLVVRLLIYAYAPGTWAVLIAESLQGVTFAGGWVAACVQAKELAPAGMEATMQGLMTAMYLGVGAGAGALLGGVLLEAQIGWSNLWLISAAIVLVGWGMSLLTERHIERSYTGLVQVPA